MSEFFGRLFDLNLPDPNMPLWPGLALLGALGFGLGFALNLGSICTVLATSELVLEKRPARLLALVECALWAGIAYALLDSPPTMANGWTPLGYLVPGAVLFAIGAYVNGACILGSVGHFGNGDINFGFTFLGILGVLYIGSIVDLLPNQPPASTSVPLGQMPLAVVLAAIIMLRLVLSLRTKANFLRLTLSMGLTAITFTALAILAPRFSITTSVGSIITIPVAGVLICLLIFGGSLVSARIRKHRFLLQRPKIKYVSRRMVGGTMMGLGALLIPGGNDELLMVGLPMGAWQAGLAYAVLVMSLIALLAKFGSAAHPQS
ncbi:YeeE/YedE thiosulfate transporter family protein [Pelagibius sp. 7325]|uniref:YeeE/YedE thiosulfate transporter family protein n=1 Tax=Pelagibius sp. 7325 TaxID=3131994 RepID=UPI0030ECC7A9